MNKPKSPITFNRPVIVGNELEYIRRAVESMHTSGDGIFSGKAAALLEQTLGVQRALLTPSCTAALEMCALLLDLQPGDEFIVPSFSFVSTANAFALRGARPVFADIREDTLNIDEARIEELISPRTRALVVMHYAGVGCEMEAIEDIARRHGLALVEDNAHGLFGRYRDRPLGTFAPLATLSFHETKNFTCGEGGALLINDPQYVERAEFIRDKGTNRQQLFRGQVDKYTWIDLGSSYVLSDILAAYLVAQLEARDRILADRRLAGQGGGCLLWGRSLHLALGRTRRGASGERCRYGGWFSTGFSAARSGDDPAGNPLLVAAPAPRRDRAKRNAGGCRESDHGAAGNSRQATAPAAMVPRFRHRDSLRCCAVSARLVAGAGSRHARAGAHTFW